MMSRFASVAAIFLAMICGCQTTQFVPTLNQQELNTHGVIIGSYPKYEWNWSGGVAPGWCLLARNLDTNETYGCGDVNPQPHSEFRDMFSFSRPERLTDEPVRFSVKLPPGRYEFFRVHRFYGGNGDKVWLDFEVPFEIQAGEIKYIGEINVDPKKLEGETFSVARLSSIITDSNKMVLSVQDNFQRDVDYIASRFPDVDWSQTQAATSVWQNTKPAYDPLSLKELKGAAAAGKRAGLEVREKQAAAKAARNAQ